MESEIPNRKCKDIYCEVCRHNIQKLGWAKHLKTKKHIENEKEVEEVEKKQCRKCGCWRVLELYRGENATCNICLGYRESWAKKNEEKVRVMNKNYWDEHKEEKQVYSKEYSQREIECEVCECKVTVIGQDIWEPGNICWGAVVEKLMVMWRVGEDDTKGKARLITSDTYSPSF